MASSEAHLWDITGQWKLAESLCYLIEEPIPTYSYLNLNSLNLKKTEFLVTLNTFQVLNSHRRLVATALDSRYGTFLFITWSSTGPWGLFLVQGVSKKFFFYQNPVGDAVKHCTLVDVGVCLYEIKVSQILTFNKVQGILMFSIFSYFFLLF